MTDLPATDEELRALVAGLIYPAGSLITQPTPAVETRRKTALLKAGSIIALFKDRLCQAESERPLRKRLREIEQHAKTWKEIANDEEGDPVTPMLSLIVELLRYANHGLKAEALAQSHKDRADRLAGALVTVQYATNIRSSERLRKLNDFVSAALQDDGGAK
jgi:hypothetical protein